MNNFWDGFTKQANLLKKIKFTGLSKATKQPRSAASADTVLDYRKFPKEMAEKNRQLRKSRMFPHSGKTNGNGSARAARTKAVKDRITDPITWQKALKAGA